MKKVLFLRCLSNCNFNYLVKQEEKEIDCPISEIDQFCKHCPVSVSPATTEFPGFLDARWFPNGTDSPHPT